MRTGSSPACCSDGALSSALASHLAAVRIADAQHGGTHDAGPEVMAVQDMLPIPSGAIAVELADGRRVFASAGSDPEAVRRYVAEREEMLRC